MDKEPKTALERYKEFKKTIDVYENSYKNFEREYYKNYEEDSASIYRIKLDTYEVKFKEYKEWSKNISESHIRNDVNSLVDYALSKIESERRVKTHNAFNNVLGKLGEIEHELFSLKLNYGSGSSSSYSGSSSYRRTDENCKEDENTLLDDVYTLISGILF